ncbi:MAG: hypothetical protein ABIQ66_11710, partial [Novosphingobium sp.]
KEFCALAIERGGRQWQLLLSRGTDLVPYPDLVAACAAADIVVADRRLPIACRPRLLKADRTLLDQTGGLVIDLDQRRIDTVAEHEGRHGWWSPTVRVPYRSGVSGMERHRPIGNIGRMKSPLADGHRTQHLN